MTVPRLLGLALLLCCIAQSGCHSHEAEFSAEEGGDAEHKAHDGFHHPLHHGHGHGPTSATLMTTSYLLIGFLVANFLMLWLVNWRDPHIRSFTWKMMSGTVSIYLAVLVNSTISTACVYVVTKRTTLSEEFTLAELLLQIGLFGTLFTAGNFLCYRLRENADALYAVSVIGGHIVAFAGIGAVSAIFKLEMTAPMALLVSGIVIAMVTGARGISAAVVVKLFHKATSEDAHPPEWRETLVETEDDATSIVSSYAIAQTLMKFLFEDPEAHEHSSGDIWKLFAAEVACILALLGTTYWRKIVEGKHRKSHGFALTPKARSINSVQITVAMTMSWLALHLSNWGTMHAWDTLEHELGEIISAALLTIFSVVGIIVVDLAADKAATGDIGLMDKQDAESLLQNAKKAGGPAAADHVLQEALDLDNLEKALRKLIDAMSLAVGLSWEHAFHAALHTVVMSNAVMRSRQICANFVMTGLSLGLMLPVWIGIIVKKANTPLDMFEKEIEEMDQLKKRRNEKLKKQGAAMW